MSVVGPASTSDTNYLTERILEELVTRHPDGSVEVWDVNSKKYYKFDSTAEIKVDYIGDQIRIEARDKSGNSYKHENHLGVFLQDLNNRTPPSISKVKIGTDFAGSALSAHMYYHSHVKSEYILHDIEVYKKRLKRLRINIKTKTSTIYRDIIPKVYKHGGRLVGILSAGLIFANAKSSGGVKVSHAIDVTVIGLAFVTGGMDGWNLVFCH